MTAKSWSKPYLGVSHYGDIKDIRRASIDQVGSHFVLLLWFRGCGFSPRQMTFDNESDAKRFGEEWSNEI